MAPSQRDQVVQLIGEKCLLNCKMDGSKTKVLLDTGAQVSLIPKAWLNTHLNEHKISKIEEILDLYDKLRVKWGNQAEIPFVGWVDITFELTSHGDEESQRLQIPFLVIEEALQQPILGFNAVKVLVNKSDNSSALINSLTNNLVNTNRSNVSTLVNLISTSSEDEDILVTTMPNTTIVSARKLVNVSCKVNLSSTTKSIPMLFETEEIELPEGLETVNTIVTVKPGPNHRLRIPVLNNSKHDLILKKNTAIGRIQQISSITPLQVKERHAEQVPECHAVVTTVTNEVKSDTSREAVPDIKIKEHQRKVLDQIDLSGLNPKQRQMVELMLIQEAAAFSVEDSDIGNVTSTSMDIKLHDNTPIQLKYHSAPKPLYAELKAHIEDLLNRGWIVNSTSPFSSPIVSVRKKDGTLRLRCDYRKLNSKTIPDKHPLPKIQQILENLGGNQYFSILDQGKVYHQLYLKPECCHYTGFITPWGLYEWVRVPFGLMNAPAVFQRFIEQCFQDYRDHFIVPYIDDLLVYSKDFNSLVEHLRLTLQRLQQHGVKIKAKKCQLFKQEVRYLGRIVAADGYRLDPKNIQSVTELVKQKPKTLGEVRRLLGMVGYFRKCIANFSKKAAPLHQLLKKWDQNQIKG